MSVYIKTLEQFLNYCTEKNKVISNNISNSGTINYKREDVEFSTYLENNITDKTGNSKHIPLHESITNPITFSQENSQELFSGVNNVDIEKEMSELAENSISFKLGSKMMGEYFKMVQYVIKGDKS